MELIGKITNGELILTIRRGEDDEEEKGRVVHVGVGPYGVWKVVGDKKPVPFQNSDARIAIQAALQPAILELALALVRSHPMG